MIKKIGKEIYQPPYAQDLSGLGAIGQVQPTGMCIDGTDPTISWCADGPTPEPGNSCSPTGMAADIYGGCEVGSSAVEGCDSGMSYSVPV